MSLPRTPGGLSKYAICISIFLFRKRSVIHLHALLVTYNEPGSRRGLRRVHETRALTAARERCKRLLWSTTVQSCINTSSRRPTAGIHSAQPGWSGLLLGYLPEFRVCVLCLRCVRGEEQVSPLVWDINISAGGER